MPRDQQVMQGLASLEPNRTQQTGVPPAERRQRIEAYEQTELFRFLKKFEARYPHIEWISASGNGLFVGYDANAKRRAADAVRAGLKRGVWDISVPFPRRINNDLITAHGMYIEMKAGKNQLTVEQERFGIVMRHAGYVCIVCHSWHEAARAILEYLGDCPVALKALADATPGIAPAGQMRGAFSCPPVPVKSAPKKAII